MKQYRIDSLMEISGRKFFDVRKANLKHTGILWLITGWEIDLEMEGGVYYRKSPVLIWLN